MKKRLYVPTMVLLAMCMISSCKLGFSNSVKDAVPAGGKVITVVCDIPEADGARAIGGDSTSLDSVVVSAANSGGTSVGSSTLTKVGGVWTGTMAVSEYGTLTFSAKALDLSSTRVRYSGSKASVVDAATTSVSVPVALPDLWYVKQAFLGSNGTTTTYTASAASGSLIAAAPYASMASGTVSVHHYYSGSGNVYKGASLWNYANNNAEFLVLPAKMDGDFSVTATINAANFNKASTASGIGVGMFSGFEPTDFYALNIAQTNAGAYWAYTSAAGAVSAGGSTIAWAKSADYTITFRRVGSVFYYATNLAGSTANAEQSNNVSYCYGCTGSVYPGITFGNVDATIKNIVIKDAGGIVVYDSSIGTLTEHITPSLSVSASTATIDIVNTAGTTVTATAVADGGAKANVSLSGYDSGVCSASVTENAGNSTITILPVSVGSTTITVTNATDSTKTKTIAVTITSWASSDSYGTLSAGTVYPAVAATGAYTDGELSITFDNAPTLNAGGYVCIYSLSGTTATLVDTIKFAGETQTVAGTTLQVANQLARVSGNTAYFTPHLGKLAVNTKYFVAIPTTSITATLNTMAFNGFSNLGTVATWQFTTRTAAPTLVTSTAVTVDGSQSGTANFRTLQAALDAIAASTLTDTNITINVAAGTYHEVVRYAPATTDATKTITIAGPAGNTRGATCTITWSNYDGLNSGTSPRPVVYFKGRNLVLKNLTLVNTWPRTTNVASQAETIYFASGAGFTMAANNCSFKSCQDTLQTSGRNWFSNCYIQGNTDFIWGTADACLIENSDLYCYNDGYSSATAVLFVARTGATITAGTASTVGKGYVLLNSTVTVDDGISTLFARDAGTGAFYDQVALVNVVMKADAAKTSSGTLGSGLWSSDSYLYWGDGSYIGWKKYNVTGLTAVSDTPRANTATLDSTTYTNEFSTRALILNRVVNYAADGTLSYADVTSNWDTSALASDFGL